MEPKKKNYPASQKSNNRPQTSRLVEQGTTSVEQVADPLSINRAGDGRGNESVE